MPGSIVFRKTSGPVPLDDARNWWEYVPGAFWKKPGGPGTTINGRDRHPVVQVAYEDAEAYAAWAGKELPSEAEWEFAARGGLDGAAFAWGDEHFPGGKPMANTWQGEFPWQNLNADGFEGTSPVGSFPPNGFGLYDVCGNVWEWTSDWFTANRGEKPLLRTSGTGRRALPAQGDQGRLASLRAELLPPVSPSRPAGRDRGHLDLAHRLPLHRSVFANASYFKGRCRRRGAGLMGAALGWGLFAASSLILGGVLALVLPIGERLLGLIMAFGAGVLISAVAYELVAEAFETSAGNGEHRARSRGRRPDVLRR